MRTSDDLRAEHDAVRDTLDLLERQLPLLPTAGASASLLTDSLATRLRSHTAKEERLLADIPPPSWWRATDAIEHLHGEHENQRTRMAILHELLAQPERAPREQVVTQASYLIKDLREHMAREETELFPVIDHSAAEEAEEAVEMLGLA